MPAAGRLAAAVFAAAAVLVAGSARADEPPAGVVEGALRLSSPTVGSTREGHRVRLFLASEATHDTARVARTGGLDAGDDLRCDTPCSFVMAPGEYRVWFSQVRQDATLHVGAHDVHAEGHPSDLFELVGGILSAVVGVALLVVAFVTGEGACFDVPSATCPVERGPIALGVGAFGVALGAFLMFDSPGYVEVETL